MPLFLLFKSVCYIGPAVFSHYFLVVMMYFTESYIYATINFAQCFD